MKENKAFKAIADAKLTDEEKKGRKSVVSPRITKVR